MIERPQKAERYKGSIKEFLKNYKVYPKLTSQLDSFSKPFDQPTINEIVLWKVARYVEMPTKALECLDNVRRLEPGQHRKAKKLVEALQYVKGIKLSMASTFLRFANPSVFQIIDGRAFRAVYGKSFAGAKSQHKGNGQFEQLAELYLKYLDDLKRLCDLTQIKFEIADRILYQFDKEVNKRISKKDAGE